MTVLSCFVNSSGMHPDAGVSKAGKGGGNLRRLDREGGFDPAARFAASNQPATNRNDTPLIAPIIHAYSFVSSKKTFGSGRF